MKLLIVVLIFCLSLRPLVAHAAESPPAGKPTAESRMRPLSGTVGSIDRGEQPLPLYLDRLEAALFLEQAHGTAGPYVVSIVNSLEAMDDKDRAGRGDRLLLDAYVMLAGYSGPQAGRLAELYVAALSQLLGVAQDELEVTAELSLKLGQIGAYSVAAAPSRIAQLKATDRGLVEVQLLLARGRYPEAVKAAQGLLKQAPTKVIRTFAVGAQVLSGNEAAGKDLYAIERDGGASGALASSFLRRAAREGLALRIYQGLGQGLGGTGVPAAMRKAAAGWRRQGKGKPGIATDQPLRDACGLLLKSADDVGKLPKQAVDCAYFLSEGPGSTWAARELPGAGPGPGGERVTLVNLARALGTLLGLPGKPPARESKDRTEALEQVTRLVPQSGLSPEDAGAVVLVAQVAAAGQTGVPAYLYPAVDKYLREQACTPLLLPLLLGRSGADGAKQKAALSQALSRCVGRVDRGERGDDALVGLALALLNLYPGAEAAWNALKDMGPRYGKVPGQARFALALADGEALRLFQSPAPPSATQLLALQRRYEEASAALLPWDGADTKGRAEAQIATLLLRRHQLGQAGAGQGLAASSGAALLAEASSHLRFAQLLASPIETALVQGMEIYAAREIRLEMKATVAAPSVDLGKMPAGVGRRYLSCELARTARAAKDDAAYGKYAPGAAGGPLPEVVAADRPRLLPSLGIDGRLRVVSRGSDSVAVLPRCVLN